MTHNNAFAKLKHKPYIINAINAHSDRGGKCLILHMDSSIELHASAVILQGEKGEQQCGRNDVTYKKFWEESATLILLSYVIYNSHFLFSIHFLLANVPIT
jgi:hypothetical protein